MNRCLDTTVAGGVYISRIHTSVAPRHQQEQPVPILEKFCKLKADRIAAKAK